MELAARAGVAVATISNLERGLRYPNANTTANILDVFRTLKELTRSERIYAIKNLRLPEDYEWDVSSRAKPLGWDFIEENSASGLQPWINHCVREMTLVVGQEKMLDLLLITARSNGIAIPESPSV